MNGRRAWRALCLAALWLIGCRAEATPAPPTLTAPAPATLLTIGVSSGAWPLAELTAAAYAAARDDVRVQFVPGNESALFADLESGALDALLVHMLPPGSDAWYNPVALDGLAIVVHPDNPVRELSRAEVQNLFAGQLTTWDAVGGAAQAVVPVGRERGAGARRLMAERVLAEQRPSIESLVQADNEGVLAAVAATPGAVGYTFIGALDERVAAVAIEGVEPTANNAGSQNYPLTTPIYFVSPAEPEGELRALLAWMQSPAGQAIAGEKYGRVR